MKIFPGNGSEKPILRDVIDSLKKRNSVKGRTIQVADKGLNCGDNIFNALKNGDGYIFSKSVKQLPEVERTWVLLDNDYKQVKDSDGNLLYKFKECVDDFEYTIKDDATSKSRKIKITEKRIVTYNPKLAKKQIFEIKNEVEKARLLNLSRAKKSEYGSCSKYVLFSSTDDNGALTDGKVKISMNDELISKSLSLAGYNMIVTSEIHMKAKDIYTAYHNLWKIEESFKVIKTQLNARPVYLQKENTIVGHFLICYLAVTLFRLFKFHILKNEYPTEKIFDFIHDFRVVKVSERKYINLTKSSEFIKGFSKLTNLPTNLYFLGLGDIKDMLSHRFTP